MVASHTTTAPVTLTTSVDATHLVQLRYQFKAAKVEAIPSYSDFLLKLIALALKKHPALNSSWTDDGIVLHPKIHIGFAVDTDAGLLVPVVRDVDSQTVREIAGLCRDQAERARSQRLSASEMQGGTFTVTNLGAFGVDAFTPIINLPQCAILGIGRIERRPAVIEDEVVARDQMTLSLTFDHRIVDGAPAARFLQTLNKMIENPGPWLMP
jgi:pyruvate dehydrogenase E2 component (dihydrolipoamide acetyltransferase)